MRRAIIAIFLCVSLAACNRLGHRVARVVLPPNAPTVEDILADLVENDARLANFRAGGKFILKTPELETTYLLAQSTIVFRRPADLYVTGRKYGTVGMRLACVGRAFLLELPTEKQYYYRPEGERFEEVSYAVSPADIAREMFLPEDWTELPSRRVALTGYNAQDGTATLEILAGRVQKRLHRRLTVRGAPWVITHSELIDRDGETLAVTTKDEYYEREGVRFPRRVECVFPSLDAQMSFTVQNFTLNTKLDDSWFAIRERVGQLRAEGYEEVEYRPVKESRR